MSAIHRMSLRLALAAPLPEAVPLASEAAATRGLISATITMAFIEAPTRRGLLQDDAARAMPQRVRVRAAVPSAPPDN